MSKLSANTNAANTNRQLHDENWQDWSDMKIYGPASRWLRYLIQCNLSKLPTDSIKTVLDVGCGQGENTALIAQCFPDAQVVGIDFSTSGIEVAKTLHKLPNLQFEVDIESLRLDQDKFDLVTCFEVLEHVDDWQALLMRILNCSTQYLLLSFPTGRMRPYEINVGHVRNFQRGEVETFLGKENFLDLNIYYAGFPFYSPIYRDLCNYTNAGSNNFTKGQYGFRQKIVSNISYCLFRYLSLHKIGDQFCGLFSRQ